MKKAVIYARFSCSSQTEQSIEGQLRVCREYAKKNDLVIVHEYIDRAKSGTNDARPSFQQMMKDCTKQTWNYVLVYKLDRFSRDKYDSAVHKHTLKTHNIRVISATENIPDSPEAIIYESLLEGFAQYYSAELSQKVKRGLKESYIKGNFTGGFQLFGYDVKDKKPVINEKEAEVVKRIFDMYLHNYTANSIANIINEEHILSKTGKKFTASLIYKLLGNTKFNGTATHNGETFENIYPKIIEDDLWNKVQEKRNWQKHDDHNRKNPYEFPLTGKLFCGDCNKPMVGESGTSGNGKRHYYYVCLTSRKKKGNCSNNKNIKRDYLDGIVIGMAMKLLENENAIPFIAEEIIRLRNTRIANNDKLKELNRGLEEKEKAISNLIQAMETGSYSEYTNKRLKELEQEVALIKNCIANEENKRESTLAEKDIVNFFKRFKDASINDLDTKIALINYLVKKVIITEEHILVEFNYSPNGTPDHRLDKKDLEKLARQLESIPAVFSLCLNNKDVSYYVFDNDYNCEFYGMTKKN